MFFTDAGMETLESSSLTEGATSCPEDGGIYGTDDP